MPRSTPAPGQLLVASPGLLDPNFVETVLLLLDVDENGALGVVLNRPLDTRVGDVLPEWDQATSPPGLLFQGGPVSTDGALAVGVLVDHEDVPVGFKPVAGGLGILDLDTPAELTRGSLRGLRVYAGYAGWTAGQLEREIAGNDWFVVPAEPGDVTAEDVADLWRAVLRRQPGEVAWNATRPVDPEMN